MELLDKNYYPEISKDLKCDVLVSGKNETLYYMGSETLDRYIKLNDKNVEPVKLAVKYMDGNHSVEDIREELARKHGVNINVAELCRTLGKAGLIINRPEDIKIEKQEMDYLAIKIKSWSLKRFLNFFETFTNRYWSACIIVIHIIIAAGLISIARDFRSLLTLQNYRINGHMSVGILSITVIFILSIGIHELSHAVVGYRYGLKPREIVFALYLGTPLFYVRVPGILGLSPRKRICVWAAGIYMNFVIASLSIVLMQFSKGMLYSFLVIICTTNISLVLGNISPLLPLDGYFILTTLIKKPNLRRESFVEFKKWILRKRNHFGGFYVIYFLVASSFYLFVAYAEIKWFSGVIRKGIAMHYSLMDYLITFKYIVVIIAVMLVKKIIESCCNIYRKRLVNV